MEKYFNVDFFPDEDVLSDHKKMSQNRSFNVV